MLAAVRQLRVTRRHWGHVQPQAELAEGLSLGCRGREESEVVQSVCPLHTGHAVTEVHSKVLEIHT